MLINGLPGLAQATRSASILLTIAVLSLSAQAQRAITPQDCVTVKYLAVDNTGQRAIVLSPNAARVVYLVKAPDIDSDRNIYRLYVEDTHSSHKDRPRLLISGDDLGQLQWVQDGVHVLFLLRRGSKRGVYRVNTITGTVSRLLEAKDDIVEYSSDATGDTLVFATEIKSAEDAGFIAPSQEDSEFGYRVPFIAPTHVQLKYRRLFLAQRKDRDDYQTRPVIIESPFDHRRFTVVPYLGTLHMSMSPDGARFLVNYVDTSKILPPEWNHNQYVRGLQHGGFPGILPTLMIAVHGQEAKLALNSPWIANTPLWSHDSSKFAVYAESPIGTPWERDDTDKRHNGSAGAHLFSVDVGTGAIREISEAMTDISKQPLMWAADGTIVLRVSATLIASFREQSGDWIRSSSFEVPLEDNFRFSEIASDGSIVVGDYQNSQTPPEIYIYRSSPRDLTVIDKLNEEFSGLTLAKVQSIQWTTSSGYPVTGYIFLPPDYKKGSLYPLVIQTKSYEGQFACDSGYNHYPSFAPQPIANRGMIYLVRSYPADWSANEEIEHYPKGYPGGISEAAFQMDIWDSAVRKLQGLGLVDPDRVGIIGFSRTGWYTEFILTHSDIHYRAATLADNVQYSIPEYWLLRSDSVLRSWDEMYGGPPFGPTLKNWTDYSSMFRLDKVHAAVLLEAMGYGLQFDHPQKMPLYLSLSMDWLGGLTRLGKPVELYYYPEEDHQPDHPRARLGTLQRNVDWYDFWLRGGRRQTPDASAQYERWEQMDRSWVNR